MSLLKIFGILSILFSGSLAAYTTTRYERRRLAVLDSWISLVSLIRGEIDCFLLPIDQILMLADRELIEGCMYFGDAPTPERLFSCSRIYIPPDGCRLLASFVREIGKGNREEQVRLCEHYLTGLATVRGTVAAELPSRLRVGCTLAIASSLALAILFW